MGNQFSFIYTLRDKAIKIAPLVIVVLVYDTYDLGACEEVASDLELCGHFSQVILFVTEKSDDKLKGK